MGHIPSNARVRAGTQAAAGCLPAETPLCVSLPPDLKIAMQNARLASYIKRSSVHYAPLLCGSQGGIRLGERHEYV